jgi:type II secretion system protein N
VLAALAYAASGIAVFVIVFTATFPYTEALDGLLMPAGLRLESAAQGWNPPLGARFSDVNIVARGDGATPPLVQSERVTVVPSIIASLFGSRAVRVTADVYGGVLHLDAREKAGTTGLDFDADALRLDQYPLLNLNGIKTAGILRAVGRADLSPHDLYANSADLHAEIDAFELTVVHGFPPIGFGSVTAIVRLKEGVLTLVELSNHGGQVALDAEGTVGLSPNPLDAALDIRFRLVPEADGPAHVKLLRSLLPPKPNSAPYVVTGTLGEPRLS